MLCNKSSTIVCLAWGVAGGYKSVDVCSGFSEAAVAADDVGSAASPSARAALLPSVSGAGGFQWYFHIFHKAPQLLRFHMQTLLASLFTGCFQLSKKVTTCVVPPEPLFFGQRDTTKCTNPWSHCQTLDPKPLIPLSLCSVTAHVALPPLMAQAVSLNQPRFLITERSDGSVVWGCPFVPFCIAQNGLK